MAQKLWIFTDFFLVVVGWPGNLITYNPIAFNQFQERFPRRNVFYVREFFLRYRSSVEVQQLVAQIGWSHNIVILQRCKDSNKREYFIRHTRKYR
jgi:hypothetical protein